MNANEQSYEVPLVELLERVPKDARFWVEEKHSSTYHPVGRLCHEAATMLRQLQAENEALKAIINEAFKSIPAMGEDGEFYHEHHGMDGEYLGYENIPANYVVQVIEAILRKAQEK